MAKMKNRSTVCYLSLLLLLLASRVAYSRSIKAELDSAVESRSPFLVWTKLSATEHCEPTYGFLPCSSNILGLLFLIVVYQILLSFAGKYVGMGSNLFFQITGPGIIGGSLFQFLGTIPQIVMILVTATAGSKEAAQERANLGMGLVAGTTVMILTLMWGTSIILGSYDLSKATIIDTSGNQKPTRKGYGVVTDVETCYTARIMPVTLIPFLIILLAKAFNKSAGKRAIILTALIISLVLLFAYIFSQVFQPWIQNRRFEYLMNKYAKDKLLKLLSTNGKPDINKIKEMFNQMDKDKSKSITAAELRVLLLGLKMDDNDLSKARDVESILESFDTSGDGRVSEDEFVRGMTTLVSDLADENPDRIKWKVGSTSQNSSQLQQGLLVNNTTSTSTSTSPRPRASPPRVASTWLNILQALALVAFGTGIMSAFAEPMIKSVIAIAQVAELPSFAVAYLAIPFSMNYGTAIQTFTSAAEKNQKSISLTLSALYGGVYMNNVISLITFLAPVYALDLSVDSFSEIVIVLVILSFMTVLTSCCTTFPRWLGYVVVTLYPISLGLIYLVTVVLGWA